MPIPYPQPRCPNARRHFEFAPPPPSWVGALQRPTKHLPNLEARLSQQLVGRAIAVSTALSTTQIEASLDEHKFRRPVTGRRQSVTGVIASRKIGRPVEYEGMNEAALINQMEIDPGVCDFRSQAVRFTFTIDGAKRHYTADFLRLCADGTLEVIEVKSDPEMVLRDMSYVAKLQRALSACRAVGWKFSVYFGQDFRAENVFNFNVQTLGQHVNVPLPDNEIARALRLTERRRIKTTLGNIIDLYDTPQHGGAKALGLIGRGILQVDLTRKLTRSTLVTSMEGTR